eukprot:TRINITY_DN5724_c1_g1_i1.p1 TRINITY_DN5724_c1_g1~~TRINITY_DN5724_c1_g1_i1.p1  ORF type:complete len:318 (-),score=22.03 TRINITY_DN5724_c1_g1_i1:34-987(-)
MCVVVLVTGIGHPSVSQVLLSWARKYTLYGPDESIVIYQPANADTFYAQILQNSIKFGAVTDTSLLNYVGAYPDILLFPMFAVGLAIGYNVPELNAIPGAPQLILDGHLISAIYTGKITSWNDAAIITLNPGLSHLLPNQPIRVTVRTEATPATLIFAQGLNVLTKSQHIAESQYIQWPLPSGRIVNATTFNVADVMQSTPYSIGYLSWVYINSPAEAAIVKAALVINVAGKPVGPYPANVKSAVADFGVIPYHTSSGVSRASDNTYSPSLYSPDIAGGAGNDTYPFAAYAYMNIRRAGYENRCRSLGQLSRFVLWT